MTDQQTADQNAALATEITRTAFIHLRELGVEPSEIAVCMFLASAAVIASVMPEDDMASGFEELFSQALAERKTILQGLGL